MKILSRFSRVFLFSVMVAALLIGYTFTFTAAHTTHANAVPSVVVDASKDAVNHPWLGLGAEVQAENNFSDNSINNPIDPFPAPLSDSQYATIFARLDYMRLNIARTWIPISDFCTDDACSSYNWNSDQMLLYYKMWDHLKADNVPVAITFAYDNPTLPFYSTGWAKVVADFFTYMLNTKGYSNFRYFTGLNETNDCGSIHPNGCSFSDWQTSTANVVQALQAQGLTQKITVTGDDFNDCDAQQLASVASTDSNLLGVYDCHDYPAGATDISSGSMEGVLNNVVTSIDSQDTSNKPVGLFEMNDASNITGDGSCGCQPTRTTYAMGLNVADYGVQLARSGMSFGSAWMLDDEGNYNGWGMWDIRTGAGPYPWFYSWSLLTRYLPAGATIYTPQAPVSNLRVVAAREADPNNSGASHWTFVFVNRNSTDQTLSFSAPGTGNASFNEYAYFDGSRPTDSNGFPVPQSTLTGSLSAGISVTVPANSMVLVTTMDGSSVSNGSFLNSTANWHNWISLGGTLTDSPTAASSDTTTESVFTRGSDGALYQDTWNGSSWSGFQDLGGPTNGSFTGAPSAVSRASGFINVYVRGNDNALWVKPYYDGQWHDWISLGGTLSDSPSASSWDANTENVFIRGSDGQLYQDTWNGSSWSGFNALGGPTNGSFTGAPSAVSRASGFINVYVRGNDNALWVKPYYNGQWQNWIDLGGTLSDSPSASAWNGITENVFIRGGDGQLYEDTWNGSSWSGFNALGGPTGGTFTGAPAAISRTADEVNVYVRGNDNALWVKSYYIG